LHAFWIILTVYKPICMVSGYKGLCSFLVFAFKKTEMPEIKVCYVVKDSIADMKQLVFSCECMQTHSVTINTILSLWHFCWWCPHCVSDRVPCVKINSKIWRFERS
jgi:hypothetical protein